LLLQAAVEEIIEKAPNAGLSIPSIIRKIEGVRNRLLRTYGQEIAPYWMDLNAGEAEYPLLFPAGSLDSVLINGSRYPWAQMNSRGYSRYYYTYSGVIGLVPTPQEDITQGLTLFYKKTMVPLTVNDLNGEVGFDPDYDWLVVYGALIDITRGGDAAEFKAKYDELLDNYLRTPTTPEPTQIQVVEW
jgi:hypothetical protein